MAGKNQSALERLLSRDRSIEITGLFLVIGVSWAYVLAGAGMDMGAMSDDSSMASMARPNAWSPRDALIVFMMWWIMMIAMMLPSASPMVLLFAALNRKNAGRELLPVVKFTLAYLIAWGGFSLIATGLQWGAASADYMSPMMAITSALLGGVLLVAAGVWQLTPWKDACLAYCRAPIHFLASNWKENGRGAFWMGLKHGGYCIGCCWVMMGLLFYGGVMNLWWIGGLALYVLIEKLVPNGVWLGRWTGVLLIVWGGTIIGWSVLTA